MDETLKEDTSAAIAVVTAVLSEPGTGRKPFATQIANEFFEENPDNGEVRLANGLIQLCIMLLAKIQLETEILPAETLQLAAEIVNSPDGDEE
ncbi:hypothetical protein FHR72_003863 [Mycolicibacterium iranicum]|uniref:Uncharacterized protein n=1 Tax=Mycolicibacterium iranicum TaxID=912594 RepID=A0A839QC29_MYCIR|nr:hypothetical protein [Mycolicibacterium iranicum]MBB2992364.1 hypothetical protein [Mycolicibacterium iranicum]